MSGDEFDYRFAWHYLLGYLEGTALVDDDQLAAALAAAVRVGAGIDRNPATA